MVKHRWKDDEVIGWARRYTARGYMTLMELEQEIGGFAQHPVVVLSAQATFAGLQPL